MTWATKRKLQYLSALLLFLLIFIGIPLFAIFYKQPTCTDGKQNQDEEGIDCGGPCVKLCRPTSLSPVVQWQQSFQVVDGVYTAVAYIQNPNVHAEAKNVGYVFTFYNAQNAKLGEKKGTMYIPAGKNFAVVETGLKFDQRPTRTFFEIDDTYTWYVGSELPELIIKNQELTDVETVPTIAAQITNPSFENIRQIQVSAIVYDADGNAMAASRTVVNSLLRESTQRIVFTWPQPFPKPTARVELIPIITTYK